MAFLFLLRPVNIGPLRQRLDDVHLPFGSGGRTFGRMGLADIGLWMLLHRAFGR